MGTEALERRFPLAISAKLVHTDFDTHSDCERANGGKASESSEIGIYHVE